jgi:predicted alpha/beta hydrolase
MAVPLAEARAAYLAAEPDVVVGSSFGGALLLMLAHDPVWRAETAAVFLAQAGHPAHGARGAA